VVTLEEDADTEPEIRLGQTAPQIVPPPEPAWMTYAKGRVGVHEIFGAQDNAYILQILRKCGLSGVHDETAWCSAFVNDCMDNARIEGTHRANARSWLHWGKELLEPRYGCIVVLSRPPNPLSGHVAFYIGPGLNVFELLGGNQHNQVCIASYPRERFLSYRWPIGVELPEAP
jgi:uncharacterized protein (TIGR02594 family)